MSFLRDRFPAFDRFVDRFGYWWAVFGPGGVLSVLGTWAADHIKPISDLGWGAVAFTGVGAACVVMLVSSVALIAWRYFNPLMEKNNSADDGLTEDVELKEIRQRLDNISKTMANLALNGSSVQNRLKEELSDKISGVDQRINSHVQSLRLEIGMVSDRLFAMRTLYEMIPLKREIERLILLLDRPIRQQKPDRDWESWSKHFKKFGRAVNQFRFFSAKYYPDEAASLTHLDPSIYRLNEGDFALENFPNPQVAHDFKTFRQMASAYQNLGQSFIDRIGSKT